MASGRPRRAVVVCLLFALALAACGDHRGAAGGDVALTFDDAPGLSLSNDQAGVNSLTDRLLDGLKRRRLPAIGFVNAGLVDGAHRAQQIANLNKWLDAGMNLGNHTYSHESPNALGARRYIEDIARGEPVTRALLAAHGKALVWFRHPYLETGYPAPVKREIDQWLAAHGYRTAPVTISADDWEFSEPYDDAIARHDEARRRWIKTQYLDYTERTIAWCQLASKALFGRQIAFVMLLHATRLNADSIDELADILKRRRLRGVTLEQAMKDPAYRLGDPYVGRDGIDWLERWSRQLHRDLPWDTWRDPPQPIADAYHRLATDDVE
jgi:peptidoglycan/xylan/chitin deacetylase (PgdA/CDA1 family)